MGERRANQCQKSECDSQAEFAVRLHLDLPSPGQPTRQIELQLSMKVCGKHQDDVRPWVLSQENQKALAATLLEQNLPEPDFLTARIEFVPIQAEPVAAWPCCDRAECAKPARWQVKQIIPEIGRRGTPRLEAMTTMLVCDDCRKITTADDFRDDESRGRTWRWLNHQGVLLPDLDKMTIEFVPLDSRVNGHAVAAVI